MSEPVYICIRATVNWSDEAAFRAQLRPEWVSTVELWNATFNIPYHLFRHRVREIASVNLAAVRGARIAKWEDVPQGGLVLPVDDDDWFSPGAGEAVRAARQPGRTIYRWRAAFLEIPTNWVHQVSLWKRRILRLEPIWLCSTNNYAVVKGPESEPLFRSHVAASDWFTCHADKTRFVDERWSLMNRTIASRTSLHLTAPDRIGSASRRQLLRKFARYRRLYPRPLPPDLAWSRPYVAMMRDLMQQLEPATSAERRVF